MNIENQKPIQPTTSPTYNQDSRRIHLAYPLIFLSIFFPLKNINILFTLVLKLNINP